MISKSAIKKLAQILGEEHILTNKDDMLPYGHDATHKEFPPEVVVFPENANEISKIMQLANREVFPIVPRGAGSGMSGGALAVSGGLVMSMERLNRILLIDEKNLIARVEPGVITGHLQEEVEKCGLFYPPDPASLDISTIGGNVAECAGGPSAVKYGVTRDYILGLKVVLPNGEILGIGVETAKGVVGYDLTRLIVGSEGTLAIITEIILRLIPRPETKKTMLVIFPEILSAAQCVSNIIKEKIVPTTIEFMDSLSVQLVRKQLNLELPKGNIALLLIELDGDQSQIEKDSDRVGAICRDTGSLDIHVACDDKGAENLWAARRSLSPALLALKPHKINQDVVVPKSRLAEFVMALSDIGQRHNLLIPSFGHAGDGNIHVNIMLNRDDKDEERRAQNALRELFKLVIDFRGTISGEHGIGLSKKPFIGMEVPESGLMLMRGIKKVFDPNGILNPGKIFDEI
jgi:glycolate oxidase